MTPYVGEIILVPYLRGVPSGYLPCDGSLQQIANYEVLYNLLGTTYGGDGSSTFGVPDLRGRVPVHAGNGPGLSPAVLGQKLGTETVSLSVNQMPAHSHQLEASSAVASSASPVGARPAVLAQGAAYASPGGSGAARPALAGAGGGLPHENRSPSLAIVFAIAWDGIYPPQS